VATSSGSGPTSTTSSAQGTGGQGPASTTTAAGGGDAGSGGASGGNGGSGGAGGGGGSVVPDSGRSDSTVPPLDASADGSGTGMGCKGITALFCDDYEAQTAGRAPSGMFTVKGAVVVEETKAFSGTKAVHIHLNNPPNDTVASQITWTRPFLPTASKDIYGRAMVWLNAVPGCCSTSNNIHWDLTTAKAGNVEYTLGSMYGNFMPVYQPGDDSVDTQTRWPAMKWVCIQWTFKGSGTGYLDVKADGVRAAPGIPVTKWAPAAWTSLNFGWINFQPSSIPVDMWFDDIAFGESEIPCP
jgi:hypothetical protein